MNDEYKKRFDDLYASLAAMRCTLDAKEAQIKALEGRIKLDMEKAKEPQAPSLLRKPAPGSGDNYGSITGSNTSPLRASIGFSANSQDEEDYAHGSIFQSRELAQAYAEAFETMLLLRHQPGTVPAQEGVGQYTIETDDCEDGETQKISVETREYLAVKVRLVSPCFESEFFAQKAIETVGADRILQMFRTFQHLPREATV